MIENTTIDAKRELSGKVNSNQGKINGENIYIFRTLQRKKRKKAERKD